MFLGGAGGGGGGEDQSESYFSCKSLFLFHSLSSSCFYLQDKTLAYLIPTMYTVIRFVSVSAKIGLCTVVGLNGTIAELQYFYNLAI